MPNIAIGDPRAGSPASPQCDETLIGISVAGVIRSGHHDEPTGKLSMRNLLAVLALSMFPATAPAAEDQPVLVELFTSQGCSSCPPADAFLHELAEREDVLPLALHVDYWDYIGWKDIFADPAHTERQRAYAKAAGRRMVYTPQMIIDGQDHIVGNRPRDVTALIEKHRGEPREITVELDRLEDGRLRILCRSDRTTPVALDLRLLRYRPHSTVEITRGENAGRTLDYANIVTEMRDLGRWDAVEPMDMDIDISGDAPIVVIAQRAGPGEVMAVARLR